jgi:hypothetical protein
MDGCRTARRQAVIRPRTSRLSSQLRRTLTPPPPPRDRLARRGAAKFAKDYKNFGQCVKAGKAKNGEDDDD